MARNNEFYEYKLLVGKEQLKKMGFKDSESAEDALEKALNDQGFSSASVDSR